METKIKTRTSYTKSLRIPQSALKKVAVRLKEEREKIEPAQKDFARSNSISVNSISQCENARIEPSTGYLYQLGQMGASVDYILFGKQKSE